MRYASRAILAGALGFAAAFVVACGGGSGLLSSDQASTLNGRLDAVSSALTSKNCGDVSNATSGLADAVVNLPASVNSTLRNNLTQGVSTIAQLARRQCANVSPTPTTTPTTDTTPTTQSQTTTTPTTPTHTTTTPTTPTTPPTTPATTSTPSGTTSTGTGGAGIGQGNGASSGGSGTGGGDGNSQ